MAEEEEVVNDGVIGEMRRKDQLIEAHEETIRDLDREVAQLRAEQAREREIHRLEQENLALRAENALQQQGQSQTPILDSLTRFGREINELDQRARSRPQIEDLDLK